jgi:hypothetical protein
MNTNNTFCFGPSLLIPNAELNYLAKKSFEILTLNTAKKFISTQISGIANE